MYKRTKLKIVILLLAVMMILFSGTLAAIYGTSFYGVKEKNRTMMQRYAKAYWENGNPAGKQEPPQFQQEKINAYPESAFFALEFDPEGELVTMDNDTSGKITDTSLTALGRTILSDYGQEGRIQEWVFYKEEKDGRTLIVLMNNASMDSTVGALAQNTLLYGGLLILSMIAPAIYLAHRIVRPLEESGKKQRQFISDASHELKTPIAVLLTNIDLLEGDLGENRWLKNIRYECDHMKDFVTQLLELARTESVALKKDPIDFSRLVTQSCLPYEGVAFENQQELSLTVKEGISVMGNEGQLGQVISILVENALEYGPMNSQIQVHLGLEHKKAVLMVRNEAEAMSKAQQEALFQRFHREDQNKKEGHYGLGLAIAKAAVVAHQGRITVESEGGKIHFRVFLPLCSQILQK